MARVKPLQCPYCNTMLRSPMDINFKDMEFTGGICPCRAVYLLDRSGRNMGETYLNALTFLSRGDYDKAMNLDPEEYETVEVDYNYQSNTIGAKKAGEKHCKIIFARLTSNEQNGQ